MICHPMSRSLQRHRAHDEVMQGLGEGSFTDQTGQLQCQQG